MSRAARIEQKFASTTTTFAGCDSLGVAKSPAGKTMADAWLQNTQDGVNTFQSKLVTAYKWVVGNSKSRLQQIAAAFAT
jgi:hypothetical protein